jgi:predicted ATPase
LCGMGTFIARQTELAELRRALAHASDGKGCALIISGEAGIGKSRLTAETIERAREMGFNVAIGSASKESMQPFLVFSGAMASLTTQSLFERKETAKFSTVMAINSVTGEIMGKATRAGNDVLDADTFAGMLSAVQGFIKDSFATEGSLRRLEHDTWKILVECCGDLSVIAVMEGAESPEMRAAVKSAADKISSEPGRTSDYLEMLVAQSFAVRNELEGLKLENERHRIANGVFETVRESCRTAPLLIILEDVHWADESSLFVLRYVARNLDGFKAMVLATTRPSEGIVAQKAIALMREEGTMSEIVLGGLSLADVPNLVNSTLHPNDFPPAFNERLHHDCAGNPFFISELLRQMLLDGAITFMSGKFTLAKEDYTMPSSIGEMVERRLESLDPDAMAMAEYASCVGRTFPTTVVLSAQSLEDPGSSLKKLGASGIVKVDAGSGEFTHALFQAAIYDSLAPRWRSAHHRGIGEHYEREHADSSDDVIYELARHFSLTQEHAKTFKYGAKAGTKAEASFAMEQAISFYECALEAQAMLGARQNDEIPDLRERLGDVRELTGGYENALKEYGIIMDTTQSPEARARMHRKIALIYEMKGDYAKAMEHLEAGKSIASIKKTAEYGRLVSGTANIQIDRGEYLEAAKMQAEAVRIFETFEGCERDMAAALNKIGTCHWFLGDYGPARDYFERSMALNEKIGNLRGVAALLNNIGNIYQETAEYPKAKEHFERGLAIFEKLGDQRGVGILSSNIGLALTMMGDLDAALEYHRLSLKPLEKIGDIKAIGTSYGNIGMVYMEREEWDQGIANMEKELDISMRLGDQRGIEISLSNIGMGYSGKGETDKALDCQEKSLEIAEKIGDKQMLPYILHELANQLVKKGRLDEARARALKAVEISSEMQIPDMTSASHRILGIVEMARGSWDESAASFEAAMGVISERANKQLAETLLAYGRMLKAKGDTVSSRGKLEEAAKVFDLLKAPKKAEEARRELDGV